MSMLSKLFSRPDVTTIEDSVEAMFDKLELGAEREVGIVQKTISDHAANTIADLQVWASSSLKAIRAKQAEFTSALDALSEQERQALSVIKATDSALSHLEANATAQETAQPVPSPGVDVPLMAVAAVEPVAA